MLQQVDPILDRAVQPNMPAQNYKTYTIASPQDTHTRAATCHEVDCPNRAKGWQTLLDISQGPHARTANWIRLQSGRRFTHEQVGTIVTFTFPAGQDCFTPHRVSLERPEFFLVQGGDFRGNPSKIPVVRHKAEDWVDDFANHQDHIATVVSRG